MDTNTLTVDNLITHLRATRDALVLRNDGRPPEWPDEALHRAAYTADPVLYALMAVDNGVTQGQQARILFQILRASRVGLTDETRRTLDRVTAFLLAILHPDQVLTVFLALRRVRANHKHTTRAMTRYLLNHPHFADMVARRRPAVVDCLEHALGKNVVRGCVKGLTQEEGNAPATTPLRHRLLRFADAPNEASTLARALYHPPVGSGPLPARAAVAYTDPHLPYLRALTGG